MAGKPASGGPKLRRLNMGQIFIILAVVSAVITIFIFKSMMGGKPAVQVAETAKTRPVVVAAQQLFAGEVIRVDSLKTIDWPEKGYPETEVYQAPDSLVGRVVKGDIYPGQPIFRINLAGENSKGGLPVVIPKGYRAMTILVTENKGVGGFIAPGDHVDVIGSFEYRLPEATQKAMGTLLEESLNVTQTVLQDVQVLAIAQEMYEKRSAVEQGLKNTDQNAGPQGPDGPPAGGPPVEAPEDPKAKVVSSVTLAVTPEQAEKLAYADARGELRLTLRPEDEHEQLHLIGAVGEDVVPLNNLFEKMLRISSGMNPSLMSNMNGAAEEPPAKKASEPPPAPIVFSSGRSVEVLEGTSKNNVAF